MRALGALADSKPVCLVQKNDDFFLIGGGGVLDLKSEHYLKTCDKFHCFYSKAFPPIWRVKITFSEIMCLTWRQEVDILRRGN